MPLRQPFVQRGWQQQRLATRVGKIARRHACLPRQVTRRNYYRLLSKFCSSAAQTPSPYFSHPHWPRSGEACFPRRFDRSGSVAVVLAEKGGFAAICMDFCAYGAIVLASFSRGGHGVPQRHGAIDEVWGAVRESARSQSRLHEAPPGLIVGPEQPTGLARVAR
jgi:hypothetical protein